MRYNVDDFRMWTRAGAELLDTYRILPRVFVGGFGYLMYMVTVWYMGLDAPSTQQAALLTTIYGAATGFFGFYISTGTKWDKNFIPWRKSTDSAVKPEARSLSEQVKELEDR